VADGLAIEKVYMEEGTGLLAKFQHAVAGKFHGNRMRLFAKVLAPTPETTVLDVGGTDFC
jgi:hypothetical protein